MPQTNHHKVSQEDLLILFNHIHKGKYDYSKVEYTGMNNKICIICPEHGEFWMTANSHKKGQGCPKCGIISRVKKRTLTQDEFIRRANEIHGGKYDYSKVVYTKSRDDVTIICPQHGEFTQKANSHLMGDGCPRCHYDQLAAAKIVSPEEWIARFKSVHGDRYDYSKANFTTSHEKIRIICPEHGEFYQCPSSHYGGEKCPLCANSENAEKRKLGVEEFIRRAREVHGDKYDYSKSEYVDCNSPLTIICKKHGEFEQTPHQHLYGSGCPMCAYESTTSGGEYELFSFIRENYDGNILKNSRKLFEGKAEIDILLPQLGIGIEYDGLYWHGDKSRSDARLYHSTKTEMCAEKNITLIHVFEDEWLYKREIVKSVLLSKMGLVKNRIFARKCRIEEVSPNTVNQFLNANHIQGQCPSIVNYGLYYDGELVSLMTFGKPRRNLGWKGEYDNVWELTRFCNKLNTSVVGGAGKLLKHFEETMKPNMVVSYADKRYSTGKMYNTLGFTHDHDSQPNYFYVRGDRRYNRYKFRKDILVKQGFDPNKSEREIMRERGIYRIYDCGNMVFKKYYNYE